MRRRYDYDRSERWRELASDAMALVSIVGLLAMLSGVCTGCGGRAVRRHARAADAMHSALDIAADSIAVACSGDAVAESDAERARRCLAADAAHTSARLAWSGYAGAVLLALEDDSPDLGSLLRLGLSLLVPYRELAGALAYWGAELPEPPALLGGER